MDVAERIKKLQANAETIRIGGKVRVLQYF